ncbi:DnaJ domain-containing protein [Desulfosporosinus sp. OT]|uniref:DnaJ domain-containing protein n=1 Tax=Desulfosporosinus sp. OT TaxID=913865 RepID=UPI000223B076|nr:DnaJ domain-containing protein [Desulfosporosinus sp. OT]EGW39556.1 dnaJ domain protein [Desulfosporosinus sp. OT]
MKDYYLILGINEHATSDEIKIAFRTLMKVWHPDVCSQNDAYDKFVEIVEAYEILNDPHQRKQYDEMRNASEGTFQPTEESSMSLFGCLIIFFLAILSFTFVAFIAYKVYITLHST